MSVATPGRRKKIVYPITNRQIAMRLAEALARVGHIDHKSQRWADYAAASEA